MMYIQAKETYNEDYVNLGFKYIYIIAVLIILKMDSNARLLNYTWKSIKRLAFWTSTKMHRIQNPDLKSFSSMTYKFVVKNNFKLSVGAN